MTAAVTVLVLVNLVLFSALAAGATQAARAETSPRLRTLSWTLAAVAASFVLSAATRLAALAVSEEVLPGTVGDFLTSEWQIAQSAAAMVVGVTALVVMGRTIRDLRAGERILTALSTHLPVDPRLHDAGLTARELEVVALVAQGTMSDREIARELFISPATAGTHIKNILRKTGCRSRRDLMLLTIAGGGAEPSDTD